MSSLQERAEKLAQELATEAQRAFDKRQAEYAEEKRLDSERRDKVIQSPEHQEMLAIAHSKKFQNIMKFIADTWPEYDVRIKETRGLFKTNRERIKVKKPFQLTIESKDYTSGHVENRNFGAVFVTMNLNEVRYQIQIQRMNSEGSPIQIRFEVLFYTNAYPDGQDQHVYSYYFSNLEEFENIVVEAVAKNNNWFSEDENNRGHLKNHNRSKN